MAHGSTQGGNPAHRSAANGMNRGNGTGDHDAAGTAAAARRDRAVRAAVEQGLLGTGGELPGGDREFTGGNSGYGGRGGAPEEAAAAAGAGAAGPEGLVALLDIRAVRDRAAALHAAFDAVTAHGQPVLHTFAVKAASLVPVLRLLAAEGIGCEAASPGELALVRAAGVPAAHTVLDSPAKTRGELRDALAAGIAVNADNWQELDRIDALVAANEPARPGGPGGLAGAGAVGPAGPVGLRINPQLGGGSIDAMSTATDTSKFGVPLRDPGARERIVRAYLDRPWLTRLHTHVGSQGMPPQLMAEGARVTLELADEINTAAGRRQIDTLDLGGGLPVNFDSDAVTPQFAEYAQLLAHTVPGLFDGRYGLVTEFGRSLLAKAGVVLARVEYTKSAGGRPIAVTHAGAQLAVRTVFAPDAWPLRVAAYDAKGRPKTSEPVVQDIAGPCCFAGDLVARGRALPALEPGDHAALLDTGAYYFSNPFTYNSLPRPGVYGYTVDDDADDGPGGVHFATVREPQTLDSIVAESGGG